MGIDFTVFKGSPSGEIVETKGHREVGPTQALVELSHCGVCGVSSQTARKRRQRMVYGYVVLLI